MDKLRHTMVFKAGHIATIRVILTIVLVALSLTGQSFRFFTLPIELHSSTQEFFLDLFIDKFSVSKENNEPTYFNAMILDMAALLAFMIVSAKQAHKDKYRNKWDFIGLCIPLFVNRRSVGDS